MTNASKNAFHGTKTGENLRLATDAEARAYAKYMIYAENARKNGDISTAKKLSELAENEKSHAELWLYYLDEVGTTDENIELMLANEKFGAEEFYPKAAELADDEGFTEVADKFRKTAKVEVRHSKKLSELADAMRDGLSPADTEWACTNCGYTTMGNLPPEHCPLCSYPKQYFEKHS